MVLFALSFAHHELRREKQLMFFVEVREYSESHRKKSTVRELIKKTTLRNSSYKVCSWIHIASRMLLNVSVCVIIYVYVSWICAFIQLFTSPPPLQCSLFSLFNIQFYRSTVFSSYLSINVHLISLCNYMRCLSQSFQCNLFKCIQILKKKRKQNK